MDGSVPGPAKVTPDELTSEVLLILSLPIFPYHFLLLFYFILFYFFGLLFMFLLWYYGRCGSTYAETGHSQRTPKLLKRC